MSTTHRIQSPPFHNTVNAKYHMRIQETYMHIMEPVINFLKLTIVRYIIVYLHFAGQVVCVKLDIRKNRELHLSLTIYQTR